jgi:hypothetical protein
MFPPKHTQQKAKGGSVDELVNTLTVCFVDSGLTFNFFCTVILHPNPLKGTKTEPNKKYHT